MKEFQAFTIQSAHSFQFSPLLFENQVTFFHFPPPYFRLHFESLTTKFNRVPFLSRYEPCYGCFRSWHRHESLHPCVTDRALLHTAVEAALGCVHLSVCVRSPGSRGVSRFTFPTGCFYHRNRAQASSFIPGISHPTFLGRFLPVR